MTESTIFRNDGPPVTPRDEAAMHAAGADGALRALRDVLDRLGGHESESAAVSRVLGTIYRLREKLRKPAEMAEPKTKK